MVTLWRRIRFSRTGFLRISRYLYFIRRSSPPSVSSSIVKGGVFEVLRIVSSETNISISPVGIFGFLDCLRSEEHTSELQSRPHLVCRLLLEKKKKKKIAKIKLYNKQLY